MSPEERMTLLHDLPPRLLFTLRRRIRRDIEGGRLETITFDVQRAWSTLACDPSCCPASYLFEVGSDEYVYVSSNLLEYPGDTYPRRRITLGYTPATRMLACCLVEGAPVKVEPVVLATRDRCLVPYRGWGDCHEYSMSEFPDELVRILSAA